MYLFLQSELLFQWCSLAQGYTAYFLMTAFIVIYHLENKQIIIIIIISLKFVYEVISAVNFESSLPLIGHWLKQPRY